MDVVGLLGLFVGIAVAASVFLASYFIFIKNQNKLQSGLLGALFLAIALRVGKSIWYFIFFGIAPFGTLLGLLGLTFIGPLILLYFQTSTNPSRNLKKLDVLHLILPILGIVFFYFNPFPNNSSLYKIATFFILVYLVITWVLHFRFDYTNQKLASWNQTVLIAVTGVWGALVFQHTTGTMLQYAWGGAISGGFIYYLLLNALKSQVIIPKSQTERIPDRVLKKVKKALEQDRIYLKRNLTLNEFASLTDLPSYMVSKTVNQLYNKSFPETINHFRIGEVKNKLVASNGEFVKIEGLAYEAGFNTPSAFYAAFKKNTGMSPKAFQKMNVPEKS